MQDLLLNLTEFVQGSSFFVYIFIIIGKIIEVSISTLRAVMASKGEKLLSAAIGVVEFMVWLLITGLVLVGIQTDIFKMLCLSVAFGIGIYVGILLEEKLAVGISALNVIMPDEHQCIIALQSLRDAGYGVTVVEGQGLNAKRQILYIVLTRKAVKKAIKTIEECAPTAVILISDMSSMRGGFIQKRK